MRYTLSYDHLFHYCSRDRRWRPSVQLDSSTVAVRTVAPGNGWMYFAVFHNGAEIARIYRGFVVIMATDSPSAALVNRLNAIHISDDPICVIGGRRTGSEVLVVRHPRTPMGYGVGIGPTVATGCLVTPDNLLPIPRRPVDHGQVLGQTVRATPWRRMSDFFNIRSGPRQRRRGTMSLPGGLRLQCSSQMYVLTGYGRILLSAHVDGWSRIRAVGLTSRTVRKYMSIFAAVHCYWNRALNGPVLESSGNRILAPRNRDVNLSPTGVLLIPSPVNSRTSNSLYDSHP